MSIKTTCLGRKSINVLLGGWGQPKHINAAIKLLHEDTNEYVRSDSAHSLGEIVGAFSDGQTYKEKVLTTLLEQLLKEEDWIVQETCYREAIRIINNSRIGISLPNYFERNRDVDWNLLQPYLEKYNLQKPN